MGNKLSHTKLNTYSDCGEKYRLYYEEKIRSKYINSYMIFGSAVDKALNELLVTKDVGSAKITLGAALSKVQINGESVDASTSNLVFYSKTDFDEELLKEEDYSYFKLLFKADLVDTYNKICQKKSNKESLTDLEIAQFNLASWMSLDRKGEIMIDSYAEKVLPRIKEVIAVQEPISLKNEEGDELVGFLDLVVRLDDDKIYLLDHKTSAFDYEADSAGKSPQLLIYHHECKEKYGIDGVGYIVLQKKINKNRKKICTSCEFDGSNGRHKSCPALWAGSNFTERCGGAWKTSIHPSCDIEIILNNVTAEAEDIVINTFDQTNEDIKAKKFAHNWDACFKYGRPCEYRKLCHENSMEGLVNLKEKK
jgi:hypothetical protein